MPIKLLHVVHGFSRPGGIENYVADLCNALSDVRDYQSHVVYPSHGQIDATRSEATFRIGNKINVHPIMVQYSLSSVRGIYRFQIELKKLIQSIGPDLVNVHSVGILAIDVFSLFHVFDRFKVVYISHASIVSNAPLLASGTLLSIAETGNFIRNIIMACFKYLSYRISDQCLAVSRAAGERLHCKYEVVGTAVDDSFFLHVNRSGRGGTHEINSESKAGIIALTIGRIVRQKRVHLLVQLARRMTGHKITFILAGPPEDLEYCAEIDESIRAYSLGCSITTIYRNLSRMEVQELLAVADINLSFSDGEGIGLSILEAGAYGIPTVAFDVPGVNEAIFDKKTGLLVDSMRDFAHGVAMLSDNPAYRNQLGAAARREIMQRHDQMALARRYDNLYSSILN